MLKGMKWQSESKLLEKYIPRELHDKSINELIRQNSQLVNQVEEWRTAYYELNQQTTPREEQYTIRMVITKE